MRGLVSLHDDRIEARSEGITGRGSEFTIYLPLARTREAGEEQSGRAQEESLNREALRILVVDDNRDSADSCAMLLDVSGYAVHVAYTGEQALEAATTIRPDAVLLDIGMPVSTVTRWLAVFATRSGVLIRY